MSLVRALLCLAAITAACAPSSTFDPGTPDRSDAGTRDRSDAGTPDRSDAGTTCVPRTCADANASCGSLPDGCGTVLDCGSCADGLACSAGACRPGPCEPASCESLSLACGAANDGCGHTLDCGSCDEGFSCVAGACTPG